MIVEVQRHADLAVGRPRRAGPGDSAAWRAPKTDTGGSPPSRCRRAWLRRPIQKARIASSSMASGATARGSPGTPASSAPGGCSAGFPAARDSQALNLACRARATSSACTAGAPRARMGSAGPPRRRSPARCAEHRAARPGAASAQSRCRSPSRSAAAAQASCRRTPAGGQGGHARGSRPAAAAACSGHLEVARAQGGDAHVQELQVASLGRGEKPRQAHHAPDAAAQLAAAVGDPALHHGRRPRAGTRASRQGPCARWSWPAPRRPPGRRLTAGHACAATILPISRGALRPMA